MRGLSEEERRHLVIAIYGTDFPTNYESIAETPEALKSLECRGLIEWLPLDDEGDEYDVYCEGTGLGSLALRVDAAARAAGVWP